MSTGNTHVITVIIVLSVKSGTPISLILFIGEILKSDCFER